MHRGYRFDLHPTAHQAETLGQWVGVTRLVYNLALEQRRDFWRQFQAAEGRTINLYQQSREVTDLRREFDFIAAVPRVCLQQAIRDLDLAFSAFFSGRAHFPTWRRVGVNDTARFQSKDVQVRSLNRKWAALKLPSLGWVKFRQTRPIGDLKNATVIRSNGRWMVALACEIGAAPPFIETGDVVGIDRGVATSLALSNGEEIRLPCSVALDRRKRRAQRILARRVRGSRRHAKQRAKVRRLTSRIARIRSHHLHVSSTDIARRFSVVGLEDLRVRNMTRSAKGTVEAPGKGVRQKAGLNRSILAQAWTRFATMLDYKLEANGGRLIYVPAPHTSQTCAACGVIDHRSRQSQAVFACVHCGHTDNADINAAKEIRRRSTALLGVEGGHPRPPVETLTLAACPSEPASAGGANCVERVARSRTASRKSSDRRSEKSELPSCARMKCRQNASMPARISST